MTNTKKKTISGAMYSKLNLEHNLREHIPPNSVEERRYLNLEDADKAQALLDDFAVYPFDLPEVCVVTQKELDDPEWKPPFEAGLIVHHMTYHGDENSPHIRMTYIPYTTHSKSGAPVQNVFSQMFEDIGYPTTMRQATTESGELVWQTDKDGNRVPQMKRNKHGGVDWVETQKMVLQKMMIERLGWDRLYKGSNPRGNLELSDYRRERAAEMAKEAELELEMVMGKVATGKAAIQTQTEQLESLAETLQKGMEAEEQLTTQLAGKYVELDEVEQELTDRKNEVETHATVLKALQTDADEAIRKANLAEELVECYKNTPASEREHEYFEKLLDLAYENQNLKSENVALKQENRTLKAKLQQTYDFMKQFTIGGMNMLEKFLRSIGEWVQQKVAGLSR